MRLEDAWKVVKKKKGLLLMIIFLTAIISSFYYINCPCLYKSTVVFFVEDNHKNDPNTAAL
jgi:hypothetical protein